MGGFPNRPDRTDFGPTYEDERPVGDTKREIAASIFNMDFWQLAGLSKVAPKVVLVCSVSGGVVTTDSQMLAFDPNGSLSTLTWTYNGAGDYDLAFSSQYPDELGNNVNLSLDGGIVLATGSSPLVGSVDLTSGYELTVNFASDPTGFVIVVW